MSDDATRSEQFRQEMLAGEIGFDFQPPITIPPRCKARFRVGGGPKGGVYIVTFTRLWPPLYRTQRGHWFPLRGAQGAA